MGSKFHIWPPKRLFPINLHSCAEYIYSSQISSQGVCVITQIRYGILFICFSESHIPIFGVARL